MVNPILPKPCSAPGNPLDIFLSGDQKLPKMLENNSKGVAGTRFTYAKGQLQLWTNNKNLLNQKFPAVLNSTIIKYIGIGNPKFVPYGFAAKEVLLKLGLFEKLKPKLILGKNINQVFVMGYFGNLDLAFVAKSDVMIKNYNQKSIVWDISQDLYSPIKQDAIMLISGKKKNGVKDFLNFLSSDYIKNKIKEHKLQAVQLHGKETPDYCDSINELGVEIIKAFNVHDDFDFKKLKSYEKN